MIDGAIEPLDDPHTPMGAVVLAHLRPKGIAQIAEFLVRRAARECACPHGDVRPGRRGAVFGARMKQSEPS